MPVVFRHEGYRFFFFSNEGDPREPVHIHVRKAEKIAKFWLEPAVGLADSYAMTSSELTKLQRIVEQKQDVIRERWNEYFGD